VGSSEEICRKAVCGKTTRTVFDKGEGQVFLCFLLCIFEALFDLYFLQPGYQTKSTKELYKNQSWDFDNSVYSTAK